MNPINLKIGLAFSGGGFRASSFSLGVLSYLNEVSFADKTLLSKVYALSTVSGGTITGARYAQGIKNGESFEEIYTSLYRFMEHTDLVDLSLSNLVAKRDKSDTRLKSIITAFADVYNEFLFDNGTLGTLLHDDHPIHLKHISFNATEFNNALQFRFQKVDEVTSKSGNESERNLIGNYYYRISEEVAKNIRMADILAASSCFPGGFEPIRFPNDFVLDSSILQNECFLHPKYPVGLMDGGIVDNQGIEPLLLAEQRLKRKQHVQYVDDSVQNELDLLVISDVTSPYMTGYKSFENSKSGLWKLLNFKRLIFANFMVLVGSVIGIIYSFQKDLQALSVLFSSLITTNLILYVLLVYIKKIPEKFKVPAAFMKPLGKLLKVKFSVYENLILNRSNSLLKMTGEVFLKHIRRLNYDKIYRDKSWKNRRIMNAIYELRKEETKLQRSIKNQKLRKECIPSESIQKVASVASSMGTTLWFTKDELKKENMLNSIIACGQFTLCWNLLDYIEDIKKNSENINENHKQLILLEDQLLNHWQRFNTDPFWLVHRFNQEME